MSTAVVARSPRARARSRKLGRGAAFAAALALAAGSQACRTTAAKDKSGDAKTPASADAAASTLQVIVGEPARGEQFLLALTTPATAAQAWLCVSIAVEACEASTPGALALTPGGSTATPGRLQFVLWTGLPLAQDLALAFVAANQAGARVGVLAATLRLGTGGGVTTGIAQPLDPATGGATIPGLPGGPTTLPPPSGLAVPQVPRVAIAYDFRGTVSRPAPTAAVIRMVVQSGSLKGRPSVRVKGTLKNLRHSAASTPVDLPATVDASGVIDVTLPGLEPDTVYRITDVRVEDATEQSLAAEVEDPYFVITAADTPLSKARRQMALKALAEAYDWDNDNYDRSKRYADSGGWCDRFYSWSANEIFSIEYPDYAPSWFEDHGAIVDGSTLATLSQTEAVHGDMIRYDGLFQGNHTFMVLSYDSDERQLWGVDGNYNNRVERSERSLESGWRLGHLNASLIR
jgi:hypothetical protein